MLRILVLVAIAVALAYVVDQAFQRLLPPPDSRRRGQGAPRRSGQRRGGSQRGGPRRAVSSGRLVACSVCGVRVPEQRAIVERGEIFCSPTCRSARGAPRRESR